MSFKDFGYETNLPCDVCGKQGDNQIEPRFNYIVCGDHYKMPPVEVSRIKNMRGLGKLEKLKDSIGRYNL